VLLANALIDNGNLARAEELLGQTLAQVNDSNDPLFLARLYWSQSRLHTFRNDNRSAARYARKALVLELTEHTRRSGRKDAALSVLKKAVGLQAEAGHRIAGTA
jgi:hypothetical protein